MIVAYSGNYPGCTHSDCSLATPGTPSPSISPTTITTNGFIVIWGSVSNATGYEVSLDNKTWISFNGTFSQTGMLSHTFTGLDPNKYHDVYVRAYNGSVKGAAGETGASTLPLSGPTLNLSPSSWNPGNGYNTTTVTVTTNQDSWQVSSDRDWIEVYKSGSTFTMSVKVNNESVTREGIVTVYAGNLTSELRVTQAAGAARDAYFGKTIAQMAKEINASISYTDILYIDNLFYGYTGIPSDPSYDDVVISLYACKMVSSKELEGVLKELGFSIYYYPLMPSVAVGEVPIIMVAYERATLGQSSEALTNAYIQAMDMQFNMLLAFCGGLIAERLLYGQSMPLYFSKRQIGSFQR